MSLILNPFSLYWRRIRERFQRRDLDHFYGILGGHIYFQTLSAAVELDLFSRLSDQGPRTRVQLAQELGVEEKPLRILLHGLQALRLVVREGDRFRNAPVAEELLTRGRPKSMVPIVRWQSHINYQALGYFYDAIKANRNVGLQAFEGDEPTLYERLAHQPELEQIFQDAMHAISAQSTDLLIESVNFERFGKVVDVGGGDGTNVISIARKYPGTRGAVFDSPTVCALARQHFLKVGLADCLEAVEGNCFEDELPDDADCILFCHFLTIWSEAQNLELLRKAHRALPEGGCVMVYNMMQDNDEGGPLTSAMGSPYFLTLATGEGMLYTWAEYEWWMKEAGFAQVLTHRLVKDHGVIIGVK